MEKCCELEVDADIKNLDVLMRTLEEELEQCDCPIKTVSRVSVCMEELFANVAGYAYEFPGGTCIIRIYTENSQGSGNVRIEIQDWGVPFDPFSRPDPDITLSAEERNIGGLGIFMVKKIMDKVEYHRDDNKNVIIMEKAW